MGFFLSKSKQIYNVQRTFGTIFCFYLCVYSNVLSSIAWNFRVRAHLEKVQQRQLHQQLRFAVLYHFYCLFEIVRSLFILIFNRRVVKLKYTIVGSNKQRKGQSSDYFHPMETGYSIPKRHYTLEISSIFFCIYLFLFYAFRETFSFSFHVMRCFTMFYISEVDY